jgi:hypothetical protein
MKNESPWNKEIPTEPGAIHIAINTDGIKCIVLVSDIPAVLTAWVLWREYEFDATRWERLESFKWWGPRINFPSPPEDDENEILNNRAWR